MSKSILEMVEELVTNISDHGCRITIPYAEPSPLTVMYDGDFSHADYIPAYPATLHISGMNGHVAISSINSIERIRSDKYVVNFGKDSQQLDMLVKILE